MLRFSNRLLHLISMDNRMTCRRPDPYINSKWRDHLKELKESTGTINENCEMRRFLYDHDGNYSDRQLLQLIRYRSNNWYLYKWNKSSLLKYDLILDEITFKFNRDESH